MYVARSALLLALVLTLFTAHPRAEAQTPQDVAALPACKASQLRLDTDAHQNDLYGMSHGGTWLVLRNRTRHPCRLNPLPQLTFADARGSLPIATTVKGARFMHPGPVVLPIALQPHQELDATLYWIAGPVYEHSVCLDPTRVTLALAKGSLSTELGGHVCGDQAKGVEIEVSRFGPPDASQ